MKKFFIFLVLTLFVFSVNAQVLPEHWTGDTGIDVYRETTDVHSGSNSVRVDVNTGTQSSCDFTGNVEIAVTAGNSFTISFYAKTSAHERVRVAYHWVGATTSYSSAYAGDGVEDADYVQFTESGTIPAGATGLNIGLRFYDQSGFAAPETQYIDDVTFESPTGTNIPVTNGDFENWPDQTSTATAPGTQLSAGTISSITTDSVPVIRFDITDAASGDGLPTVVTGINFVSGPDNTLPFDSLNGGGIYDLTNSAVIPLTSEPSVNATSAYLPVNITIPDGATVSFEAYAYINNIYAPDGAVLQFQINAASHGFTADATGSGFESTFAGGNIVGNDFTIAVVATQFTFITQPSDVVINQNMSNVVVGTTDAGGNVDVDYPDTFIQLNFSGTGSMSGASGNTAINGTANYPDLNFNTPQTAVHLTASGGSFADVLSTNFDILSGNGGADCANAVSINVGTHHAAHTVTDDYDQWYVYTAPADGTITAENCSSGYGGDTYLEIIEGSCSGTNFDQADDICGSLETLTFNVTAGNDYYIAWGDWDTGTPGEYDWTLTFTPAATPINIINAYSVNEDSLVVFYESGLTSVNPADYTLTAIGQVQVNFTQASIDATHDSIVYLKAQSNFTPNTIRDNLNDAGTNSTPYQFYAGVLPIAKTNTANATDTVRQGYNFTLAGIVTANDNYNQVWIQDSNNAMSGVMIFSSSFTSEVAVGDSITIVGQKALYNGATEIVNPLLINKVSSFTPSAATVNSSDLAYSKSQDDADAEPWEGQLVALTGITIDSLNTSYYEYFGHNASGDIICFDDDVDYHYGSGFSMDIDKTYDVTGVVTFSYGHYKVNPRSPADASETAGISNLTDNAIKIYPNPAQNTLFVKDMHNISELSIVNVLGKTIDSYPVNSDFTELNINNLKNGLYFIRFNTNSGKFFVKTFVKN
ncbi:MAG: T9SS type A sorting domain-containing protein [Chlorobi bacterium]|nr:T9SS type A sorting domain-containing protein [Chlorobiota bacterium]